MIFIVGAGVGTATKPFVRAMVDTDSSLFSYTYTDVSNAFLQKGRAIFEGTGGQAQFKLLDIEKDPMAQGFCPGQYDLIVAAFVLHAMKDLKKTLLNLKQLLKPNGQIVISELTSPNTPTK